MNTPKEVWEYLYKDIQAFLNGERSEFEYKWTHFGICGALYEMMTRDLITNYLREECLNVISDDLPDKLQPPEPDEYICRKPGVSGAYLRREILDRLRSDQSCEDINPDDYTNHTYEH